MFQVVNFHKVQCLTTSLPSMEPRAITPVAVSRVDLLSLTGVIQCLPLHVIMACLFLGSPLVLWSLLHQAI